MYCHICGNGVESSDNYCSQCGSSLVLHRQKALSDDSSFSDIVKFYFEKNYTYTSIVENLKSYHNVVTSLRTVKRTLKRLGLQRIKEVTTSQLRAANNAIGLELCGPGRQMGYRLMTKTLHLKYGIMLPRNYVMRILRRKDPVGTDLRLRHVLSRRTYTALGPSYLWHADGHDKLKRFGFAIHACIDGYSRRVLWVDCCSTNNNPNIVAYYYLTTVKQLGGCPRTLRTDCGTENTRMAEIQCQLRNSLRAHIYGTSQHNQRIESWWSYLGKMRTKWWISYFDDLEEAGLLNIDRSEQIDCLRFCYMDLLRRDLYEVKQLWNAHRIRKSYGARCPGGIPEHLFFTPGRQALQCLNKVSEDMCASFMHLCESPITCQDRTLEETMKRECVNSGVGLIRTANDALRLFVYLKSRLG